MLELCGKSVSKGIAIGKIYFHSNINNVPKYEVENPEKELERYKTKLLSLLEDAIDTQVIDGKTNTSIFVAYPKGYEG